MGSSDRISLFWNDAFNWVALADLIRTAITLNKNNRMCRFVAADWFKIGTDLWADTFVVGTATGHA